MKLDSNWSSFQLANSAPPLSVTDSAIAPSARMLVLEQRQRLSLNSTNPEDAVLLLFCSCCDLFGLSSGVPEDHKGGGEGRKGLKAQALVSQLDAQQLPLCYAQTLVTHLGVQQLTLCNASVTLEVP